MRVLAYLLLLLHVNSFLLISQVDEQDLRETRGQHVCDIDSLTDWLQQSLAKEKNTAPPNDKNDDRNTRVFHILKPHHFFSPPFVLVKKTTASGHKQLRPVLNDTHLFAGFYSIQSPPPKA